MNENWRRLKPTDVAKWINFGGVKGKWTYSPDQPVDMAALQTEGVAHLWNVLSRNPVALLADEVGMGKTFEALGVAALLWRRKPDAKILVIAPNRDICAHWQREFSAFTRDIYLKADDFVKAKNDGKPAPPFGVHYRLHELTEAIEQRSEHDTPAQFYITTIHALSGLVDSSNESTDKTAAARRAARELHRRIMAASEGAGFDLMIVDEAHYFRNRRGGSQRVAAAEEFFGKPEKPIAQRTLLLTATPSHTRLGDVASILGYFLHRSALEEKTVDELMRKYALRRFRRMEGQGISYTKHQYRREIATPCQFGDSSQDEMFFALYQKLLIKRGVVNEEKRRALYGYLEGFESAGYVEGAQEETQGGAEEDERSKDFRAAADTKLLQDMSSDFRRLFGTAPDHPKYDGIVKICAPQNLFEMPQERHLHEDKHLVFVRRIPSVRELTKRINERYDDLLAQHIADALAACRVWHFAADTAEADP
ncbi:MAG: DEAD/DEAH box helicase family protein, partial [Acetobacter aceti]